MSVDASRDCTRYGVEDQKRIYQEFNEKKNSSHEHDLWAAQQYRAQLNSKETTALFDQWYGEGGSGPYEKELADIGYKGPEQNAGHLAKYLKEPRDQYKIMDIAAGSGLSGYELKKVGFTHIDWLDPSQNAVEPAKEKQSYERFFVEYLTEKPLDVGPDTYDAVVCVGAFFEGLVPVSAFTEMIRIVKPGGYVIISISETSLGTCKEYKGRLVPKIQELIDAKEWELVEKVHEPHYLKNVPAVFYILRVLRSG